ncbi:AraC family transcriptional regulator [Nonomuraea sp. NPDC050556]|uniref:AraC family transcriptional regulator n=1 Tax=Nonomuraea sp. NPDC050556 TaxID=3364369 RepID=UPI003793F5A4
MDVLSDVIAAMRIGRPHSSLTHREGPWRQEFPETQASGFHIVLSGTCQVIPAGQEPITMSVGDVAFLPRGLAHEIAADGVLLCGAYQLDRSRSHPLLEELPEVIRLPARLGQHPSLRATVDLLAAELHEALPGSSSTVPALLDVLLLLILRTWLDDHARHRPATGWAAALADPALARALSAMHGDPARAWTIHDLAAEANLSKATLARRFTALVGRPPLAYLTWWRLTVATRVLRDSDAPLSTVAGQVGYSSEYAFANAFKRQHGIAPGRYRKASNVSWDSRTA